MIIDVRHFGLAAGREWSVLGAVTMVYVFLHKTNSYTSKFEELFSESHKLEETLLKHLQEFVRSIQNRNIDLINTSNNSNICIINIYNI